MAFNCSDFVVCFLANKVSSKLLNETIIIIVHSSNSLLPVTVAKTIRTFVSLPVVLGNRYLLKLFDHFASQSKIKLLAQPINLNAACLPFYNHF